MWPGFLYSGQRRKQEKPFYTNGWQEQTDAAAVWQVKNGKYNLNISYYNNGASSIYQNGFFWQDYSFSFDAELNDGVDRNVIFRRQDDKNYYSLGLRGFWRYAPDDTPVIYLQRCYQGQCVGHNYWNYFVAYHFNDNKSALNQEISHFDIEAIGSSTKVYYNHNLVIDWQEPNDNYPKFGTIGFSGWTGGYETVDVAWDNLIVKTLADEPVKPEPVILVPGIMGSWNISGRWQIDPIFHTYDNLMEALMAAGYKEPSLLEPKGNLFTFPYDWRQDNNLTANLLKQKIQEVKAITGASRVDIIAHSLGGLVARSYIEGSDYQNDIDQVIFLGTPHRGAVDTYLKYGGAYFSGHIATVQKYFFQTEAMANGYIDLTDYIRTKVPTVEQLLPVYDYLKDKQPDNSWQLRTYPLNYPQNNYLENLNSQAKIDLLKQRVNVTNIISDLGASSTLNYLRVVADPNPSDNKWQSGYPENLGQNLDSMENGNGDSTVPFSSASSLTGVETIESASADHANLPTIMQKEIIKTLTGKLPVDYFNNKITSTIKRWFFFRIYSPVDFLVISPNGQK